MIVLAARVRSRGRCTKAAERAPSPRRGAPTEESKSRRPLHPAPRWDRSRPSRSGWCRDQCRRCSLFFSNVQLQLPAPCSVLLQATKLEQAELGHGRLQMDRGQTGRGLRLAGQGGLDRSELLQLVRVLCVFDPLARFILAAHRGSEEAKPGALSDNKSELLWRDVRLGSFLHSEGRHAQGPDWRRIS